MPFFENARQFEINGGNFIDLKGNQNNYHYDQSVKVSGQGNSAVYSRGPYYNGPDNRTTNSAGHMTVMGQGSNARVALDQNQNTMPLNYHGPNYAHQSYAQPPAQSYGYGPSPAPNGMFYNSTGHVNVTFPAPSPQQQPQQFPNTAPPSPHSANYQHPTPSHHFPAHHSQPSINSAPAAPPIQINQFAQQTHIPQINGSLSSNTVPQPSSQQSTLPPRAENQTRPPVNPLPAVAVTQSSPSASSSTGSTVSGTTLAQTPQATQVASPSMVTTSATTTATEASTSLTSSPVAPGQPGPTPPPVAGLEEFPGLVLKPGATVPDTNQEGKKKKKKKNKFFSKLFGKTPKVTGLAVDA